MKRITGPILLVFFTLALIGLTACGAKPQATTYTTPPGTEPIASIIDFIEIPVEITLTDISPGATEVTVISVGKGTLLKPANNLLTKNLEPGASCLIVSVGFENNLGNETLAMVRLDGYDSSGELVSQTFDPGPLVWMANYDIPAGKTQINMTANWADDLARITLNIQMRRSLTDVPIIPATTIPEEDMAIVWFDEAWLTTNDTNPDTEYVHISFPAAWLETGQSDSFNGTGIALRVPKQMLQLDNESHDPGVITISFPLAYFVGRPGAPATRTTENRLTIQTPPPLKPEELTPSTTVPEEDMAVVWFEEAWLINNDTEPDPDFVHISFPAAWLETGQSDSFNGTGIALRVPKQMLQLDNESHDPGVITVSFPLAYFVGRPGAPATRTP